MYRADETSLGRRKVIYVEFQSGKSGRRQNRQDLASEIEEAGEVLGRMQHDVL